MKNKLLSIDDSKILRGGGAALILLHHIIQFLPVEINIRSFGHLGVALFFFLSGFGLQERARENKDYLKGFIRKHIVKLYGPYLIATVVYILVRSVFGISYTVKEILMSLVGLYTIVNFSWYIFLQLILYLAYWLIQINFKRRQKRIILLTTVIMLIIGCCIALHLPSYCYVSLLAFPAGVIVSEYQQTILKVKKESIGILLVLFSVICFLCYVGILSFAGNYIFQSQSGVLKLIERGEMILCDIAFIGIITLLCSRISLNSKLLYKLGLISYEIYLFQGLFIKLFTDVLSLPNDFAFITLVIVCVILTAIVMNNIDSRLVRFALK